MTTEALATLGYDEHVAARFDAASAGFESPRPARVVRVERGRCIVATGTEDLAVFTGCDLTVGDWVVVDARDVAVARLDRTSSIARVDPRSEGKHVDTEQVLCANVDVVFIVEPLDRALRATHVDRLLALAWQTGATPVVVLTKADAHADAARAADELAGRVVGVDVVTTSSLTRAGVDDVHRRLLPHRTGVLLGASGAGKSTLANALVGHDVLATGAVRDLDHRGRHTTTARALVQLPGGGVLIDTPGLRSIGLWDAAAGVAATFPDVDELALDCRFADCGHEGEPGCAVRAAIEAGTLAAERLDRWRKLAREVAWSQNRQDPASRAENRKRQRQMNQVTRSDAYRRRNA